MSRSFTDNNVTFNNISASTNTGGTKISSGNYVYDEEGNIIESNPVVNSIDIDWNSAQVPGLNDPVNSTGQLLSIIGTLQSRLNELSNTVDTYHTEYSFVCNLTRVSKTGGATTMKKNDIVELTFTPEIGYILPNTIVVENATYEYNKNTGVVTISKPTASEIMISIAASDKRICNFNIPTLTNLSCSLEDTDNSFTIGETFNINLSVTGDSELWGLPSSISGNGCTIKSYNNTTGLATIQCTGTGDMTISASAKDVATYYFAVALESNTTIFTTNNGVITNCNMNNIESVAGYMKTNGSCPINFVQGFTPDNSVSTEGQFVWFIIPSKYFNVSNFNFINGSNKYLLKQSNIQDLTTATKIKDSITQINGSSIIYKKVEYTLVCVSNNGLGGAQEFKKV